MKKFIRNFVSHGPCTFINVYKLVNLMSDSMVKMQNKVLVKYILVQFQNMADMSAFVIDVDSTR